jgi:hypothetical protein
MAKNHEIIQTGYPTADRFYWQEVIFGPGHRNSSEQAYRGYLMIEPEDFPRALDILRKIGSERKKQGKSLDLKWLRMTYPEDQFIQYLQDQTKTGSYKELKITDPRIVIYGDTAEEVQEILGTIVANPEYKKVWDEIEANRIKKCGGKLENAPRRPGTNAFESAGHEKDQGWRSINYNNNPGYSEAEAADPDWRASKVGAKSVPLKT